MSRNTVVLDDQLWVFDHLADDNVLAYKATYLGKFIGEFERMTSSQAIAQILWCHKSGYQITTE